MQNTFFLLWKIKKPKWLKKNWLVLLQCYCHFIDANRFYAFRFYFFPKFDIEKPEAGAFQFLLNFFSVHKTQKRNCFSIIKNWWKDFRSFTLQSQKEESCEQIMLHLLIIIMINECDQCRIIYKLITLQMFPTATDILLAHRVYLEADKNYCHCT